MRSQVILSKKLLEDLYLEQKLSSSQIAKKLSCSESKINYWLSRYLIPKRTISEAVYGKLNPTGDPFSRREMSTYEDAFMLGLGLGLYWGEGNKKDPSSVRLGNSDPALVRAFLGFLESRFDIDKSRLRFGLQVFSDMDTKKVEGYWAEYLDVNLDSFYKTVVTISGKVGTYREKTKYGVMTLYFHNSRLKRLLMKEIDNLQRIDYSSFVLPKEERPM